MAPLVRGGGQERNRRAGTENVAGLVGFGAAAALAREGLEAEAARLAALRDRLEGRLLAIPGALRNGGERRLPNTANVSFEGTESEALLIALDLEGIAVSTGAACAAGGVEPSHVLRAMGLPPERVQSSLRLSLGRATTEADVDHAADVITRPWLAERNRAGGRSPSRRKLATGEAVSRQSRPWDDRCSLLFVRVAPFVATPTPGRGSPRGSWSGRAAPTRRARSRGRARTSGDPRTPPGTSSAAPEGAGARAGGTGPR